MTNSYHKKPHPWRIGYYEELRAIEKADMADAERETHAPESSHSINELLQSDPVVRLHLRYTHLTREGGI